MVTKSHTLFLYREYNMTFCQISDKKNAEKNSIFKDKIQIVQTTKSIYKMQIINTVLNVTNIFSNINKGLMVLHHLFMCFGFTGAKNPLTNRTVVTFKL